MGGELQLNVFMASAAFKYVRHFVHSALIPHAAVVCMGIFNALLLNCTLYNVQLYIVQ